jgi:hypothetical protein
LAKRTNPAAAGAGEAPQDGTPAAPAADVLGDFAADLGKFLGGVQSRATSWLQQRKEIADQLTQIRDTANHYLRQLGLGERVTTPSMLAKEVAKREGKARRGRPPGSKQTKPAQAHGSASPEEAAEEPAEPRKRFMSAEARARIAEAQRKRWAKLRRGTRNANR